MDDDGLIIVLGLFGLGYLLRSSSKLAEKGTEFIKETQETREDLSTSIQSTSGLWAFYQLTKLKPSPLSPLGILQNIRRSIYG